MKKSVLLGLATLALAATATTVSAQEVTYEPDCSQGLLYNRNADNWFITAQGGTNIVFGPNDIKAELKNRFGANAGLYVGKWVSPIFGFRFGGTFELAKGACPTGGWFQNSNQGPINDAKTYMPEKWYGVGPEFDVLINLTNWWCGYKPNRVYNAVFHGGANAYWRWRNTAKIGEHADWHAAHCTNMSANVGLQNNFRLSKHVTFFIDFQYEIMDFHRLEQDAQVFAGLTFNLGKTDWNCPVTAVCPTWKYTDAEGDALVAQIAGLNNQINKLQRALDECDQTIAKQKNNSKGSQIIESDGLCTIYFPINQYGISSREKTILKSAAEVMKANPDKKFVVTGWADNYTGSASWNDQLRELRYNTVHNYLLKLGVAEDQMVDPKTENTDLQGELGKVAAPLDRAVTIRFAK